MDVQLVRPYPVSKPGLTSGVLAVVLALVASLIAPTVAAAATLEIGVGDADHVFTFVDDVVGEKPDYVSLPWQQTGVEVIDSNWALDGRALQISPYGSNAFFAAVFDSVPEQVNTEVLMRFRDTGPTSTSHWMSGAGARITGTAENETAVLTQARDGDAGLVLARVNAGSHNSSVFSHAQQNYLRTRWVDGVVSARMWSGALADEPEAWSVAGHALSQPTLAAGGVGITRFFADHTTEVDYITVDEIADPEPQPRGELRIMPVGDSITTGSTNAPGPQPTYRMYLYDHLVASGLEPSTDLDFVGPYDTHPSSSYDYVRQGQWDHDSLAVSGWRSADVRDNIASAVTTYDPDVLLVMIGVNDILGGTAPTVARDRVDLAIANARQGRSDIKILLAEIPPAQSTYDANIETYNTLLSELAASRTSTSSPVEAVDLYTGYDRNVHHYDNLHPNELGDELIASRWADALHTEFGIGASWDPGAPAAPGATITAGPQGMVESTDANFAFTSDTAGASFECRLVDDPYEPCSSPFELTALADGSYTFEVRASAEGLTGDPASRTWTVQRTAPGPGLLAADPTSVVFDQLEVGTLGSEMITLSNTGASTLTVSGTSITGGGAAAYEVTTGLPIELAPDATAELDIEFAPSVAGDATAVLAIEHTGENPSLEVALNGEGTAVTAPTAPGVTITSGPQGTVGSTDASFEFASDTAGASFECRLVDEAFAACASPFQRSGLADGDYTFEVRASAEGLTGEPASRTWTVQRTAPGPGLLVADPDSVVFGQLEVGTLGSEMITLSNTGASTLTVSGTSITGGGAAAYEVTTGLPIELAPDATAELDIEFAPSVAGDATAVLAIEHTGENPSLEVALSGEGTSAPGPDPTPDPGPDPTPFSDISGTTHADAIVRMADLGVTFGFKDGTYRPNAPVKRGQMASLIQRVLGLPEGDVTAFADVEGTTHAGAIAAISEAEIAFGYTDGTFRPEAFVTRGQMAAFLERAFELPPGDAGVFKDALGTTHADSIGAVAAAKVAFGRTDGTFRPADDVTRGQMASFLDRALER